MGQPLCMSTAPTSEPDASVSKMNDREKSGNARTGDVHILFFRVSKALVCSGVHKNEYFFSKLCKGLQIKP
jgi:hypothetical protein